MKTTLVRQAIVEEVAIALFWGNTHPEDITDSRREASGALDVATRLGFDRSELRSEAHALVATPTKIEALMKETKLETVERYGVRS